VQPTRKTLTSLRQGSLIHVFDQDFSQKAEETFHEAYMAHTSTSPNYQILASLDLGRRQADLEGFELVQKQIENAMRLRGAVDSHPLLSRYMRCLTTADLIPAEYRPAGIDQPLRSGLPNMIKVWNTDEFVLDPSRITIYTGATGIGGDTSPVERAAHERAVLRLTAPSAPLPDFSGFHPAFADEDGSCPSCAAWTRRRCTASAPTSVTWSTPARRWKSPPRPAAAGSGK
jgi:hypothetical protein